jgi:hypothetical protein
MPLGPINPFEDEPPKKPTAKPRKGRQQSSPIPGMPLTSHEAIRISRQVASEANAGRSSYTMSMLIIMTISCAAILGVCGTTLQNLVTDDSLQGSFVTVVLSGVAAGIVFGVIVGCFVRISPPTVFLSGMMGGLLGALTTPAAMFANRSPTAALIAAAFIGPLLILTVSYAFSVLSRRSMPPDNVPPASSPWAPIESAKSLHRPDIPPDSAVEAEPSVETEAKMG